jgi:hypothetical protein
MARFMMRRFVLGSEAERAELDLRLRLILHSWRQPDRPA